MTTNIDELFGDDAITVYPDGTSTSQLYLDYYPGRFDSEGKKIDFDQVQDILSSLGSDVGVWYKEQTGLEIDTYNLGEMLVPVQNQFWTDFRFKKALELLGIL